MTTKKIMTTGPGELAASDLLAAMGQAANEAATQQGQTAEQQALCPPQGCLIQIGSQSL